MAAETPDPPMGGLGRVEEAKNGLTGAMLLELERERTLKEKHLKDGMDLISHLLLNQWRRRTARFRDYGIKPFVRISG